MTQPQWRDRPNVAGLWIWLAPGNKPCAWMFTDKDVVAYKPGSGRVFGPVPNDDQVGSKK